MKKFLSVLTLLLAMATSSMAQNCNAAWVDTIRNGCSIQFYGYGVAGSNPPVHMYWQFGDGTVHSGLSNQGNTLAPIHFYATSGTYTVCLHVTDSINNCYNVYCDTVIVNCGNPPCSAQYTWTANSCAVTFTNTSQLGKNYSWNFGDGSSSVGYSPTHYYQASGTYYVCLTVSDSSCSHTYCDSVTVTCSSGPCQALFTDSVHNGCTVSFYNYSQGITNGTWFSWNFGDGNYGWQTHPTHTYSQSGWYRVCLTMTDSANNCYDTYCDSIYVNCPGSSGPCAASFTGNASGQGCTWHFQSTSQNASFMQWWWNDGSPVQPVTPHHTGTVSHTFPSSGVYTVCLYLYDSAQQWCDSTCMTIVVNCQGQTGPCAASFTGNATGQGCTWHFQSTSQNASFMQWWWNDGSPVQPIMPHHNGTVPHTFPTSGTYNVCLYLYDSAQQWCDSTCMTIVVNCQGQTGPCISQFQSYPDSANPCTVYFWSTSPGGSYMQWWWNDGSPTQPVVPHNTVPQAHTFPGSGTYNVCLYLYDSAQQWCDSTCMTVTVNCPTGITETGAITGVNVFPNPAEDMVTIEAFNNGSSDVEITLTDVSGRRVYFTNLNASHNIRHTIPVRNYHSGIYMLNVRSGSSIVTEKLIIH